MFWYRAEAFSGSKTRNVRDIIRFEISMANTDIISYVRDNYGILNDFPDEEHIEDFIDNCMENAPDIADEIVSFLERNLEEKEENLYGLWLTNSLDTVCNFYNKGAVGDIDIYLPCEENIILSDLGDDGKLFVFSKEIFPIGEIWDSKTLLENI